MEFENATLKYEGAGESSIENVNFKAKTGQTIGIIGGTGSGKTSLINMIPRFYDPTEGKVKIFGIDAKDYKRKNLEDIIGVVPQKALLFKGTIRSNLLWGNENATEEELVEALKLSQSYIFLIISCNFLFLFIKSSNHSDTVKILSCTSHNLVKS